MHSVKRRPTITQDFGSKVGIMSRERLYLFDTTLRDGAQTSGVDFTLQDKRVIAQMLDDLGLDYVEGGYPGANPADSEIFSTRPKFALAKFTAYQVQNALKTTKEENLASIRDSISAAVKKTGEAMLDCDHFFDCYKEAPEFALACAKAAYESGARWVVLCDTNGGTMPDEITKIVGEVTKHIPGSQLGIHAHDDTGQAVANSLAAVRAGVRQIQGTLTGLGERCGNANL